MAEYRFHIRPGGDRDPEQVLIPNDTLDIFVFVSRSMNTQLHRFQYYLLDIFY